MSGLKRTTTTKTIRKHLRILDRVSTQTMDRNGGAIKTVLDIFQPKHYGIFVSAILDICSYGKKKGQEIV